ncbi:hypothetical protein FHX95_002063 [Clostridium saccharobutylicum]|nr:hypothetical protein [Clostridium saccharobutylicum]NYC30752.1 hypothetical protein [Clostridium saccharobutylicum]
MEELTKELLKEKYYYYVILSSYGLEGWILAKNYEVIVNN